MNLTSYTEFCMDCELIDNESCFLALYDNIFVATNASTDERGKRGYPAGKHDVVNNKRSMMRHD